MHRYVVGIDWAQDEHAVCVLDADGKVHSAFTCAHSREGLAALVRRLARIASASELPVAIERPSGLLVDVLVEAGHPVVPIHPNALKASRPRYRAAGGKSDPGDAFILAELGDDPLRFPSADQLAAEAGVVPVTRASGKRHAVAFRWACNKRLRAAITTFAHNSRHASPWAAHLYQKARARGSDHPHAVRILARAWIRVLWRAWTDAQPYDPARHQAAQNLKIPA